VLGDNPVEEPEIHHNHISVYTGTYICDRLKGEGRPFFLRKASRLLPSYIRARADAQSTASSAPAESASSPALLAFRIFESDPAHFARK